VLAATVAFTVITAAVPDAEILPVLLPAVAVAAAAVATDKDDVAASAAAALAITAAAALALSESSGSDSDGEDGLITAQEGLSVASLAALTAFMAGSIDEVTGPGGGSDGSAAGAENGIGERERFVTYTPKDTSVIEATMMRLEAAADVERALLLAAAKDRVLLELEALPSPAAHGDGRAFSSSSSSVARDDVSRDAVATLLEEGVVRLNSVLSPELCDLCLATIEANLLAADYDGGAVNSIGGRNVGFGNVFSRQNRFDMYLKNEGVFKQALGQILGAAVGDVFRHFYDGRPCDFHELSALVSDSGSASQPIHPDSKFTEHPILHTCFVALQDIDATMGPTLFLPGTNNRDSHDQFTSTDSATTKLPSSLEYRHALLRKGDCTIMDSRTLHCGTENRSGEVKGDIGKRRVLFYFTLRSPLHSVNGLGSDKDSDYPPDNSLFPGLRISTAEFERTTEDKGN